MKTLKTFLRPDTDLVLRAKGGCQAAKTEVIKRMHSVVCKIARYLSEYADFDDVYQSGCIGLLRAIQKFEPRPGVKFSTFAYWYIREAAMLRSKRDRFVVSNRVNQYKTLDVAEDSFDKDDNALTNAYRSDDDVYENVEALELARKTAEIVSTSKRLNDIERAIITDHLMGDATLQNVGDKFEISREAVRQREERLLAGKLRQILSPLRSAAF